MAADYGKAVLITGASSGIGKACAEYLRDQGYHVYGGSRRVSPEDEVPVPGRNGGWLKMLRLDVRDEASVRNMVGRILAAEGHLGVVINCAGYTLSGSVEDTTPEEAHEQMDTNFYGPLRVYRAVLPGLRKQGGGLIVTVSSVAGFIPIPFQPMYSASKYALEAMTEAMRMEVAPFGVKVSLVEPGDIKTGFTSARAWTAKSRQSVYADRCARAVAAMAKSEQGGPGPEIVVRVVAGLLRSKNPPVRVIVGVQYKLVGFLKRIVTDRFLEFVLVKMYS
ncbi:MAG TPA: SDR family oxidoreductase [Bacillota bacterium]